MIKRDNLTVAELNFFEERYSYGLCWLWWYTKLAQEGLVKSFPEGIKPSINYGWLLLLKSQFVIGVVRKNQRRKKLTRYPNLLL